MCKVCWDKTREQLEYQIHDRDLLLRNENRLYLQATQRAEAAEQENAALKARIATLEADLQEARRRVL